MPPALWSRADSLRMTETVSDARIRELFSQATLIMVSGCLLKMTISLACHWGPCFLTSRTGKLSFNQVSTMAVPASGRYETEN